MQRPTAKGPSTKDLRTSKLNPPSSKLQKNNQLSSSKNIKSVKRLPAKGPTAAQPQKLKAVASPEPEARREADNDYGVNPYYSRYKVKTSLKREPESGDYQDYGNFSASRDVLEAGEIQPSKEGSQLRREGSQLRKEEGGYAQPAFQKIKLPYKRGMINAEGKFVTAGKQKQPKNHSFQHRSTSRQSFSLNFTAREESQSRKKLGKSKLRQKGLREERSLDYRLKGKSGLKGTQKQHHSYYERSRKEKSKSKSKKKVKVTKPALRNDSLNSKTTSVGVQTQYSYFVLPLTQDASFMDSVKDEIVRQIGAESGLIRREKLGEAGLRERSKCLLMLSRLGGAMGMKRQSLSLAIYYLDSFICQFPYPSMKLVTLGCLTLALKMDDAEMVSKFCYNYLYNPEKTVRRNGCSKYLRIKQKREEGRGREVRSRLSVILGARVAEERSKVREEFSLEEVLDFQTQIMVRLGYRLAIKSLTYWIDLLTALWDSYLGELSPRQLDTLTFRDPRFPRGLSYLIQLIDLECLQMGTYRHSLVSLILAALYLVARMGLQERREGTPWEELCRNYRVSLSKSANLIFCDGIGFNMLFGDFLTLFELNMSNLIECIQTFSQWLDPQRLRQWDYRAEGLNRQDRLATHQHNEELYRDS